MSLCAVRSCCTCQFSHLRRVFRSPELLGNQNAKQQLLRSCTAFFLGGLCASIRFTAIAAFVPMGIVLALRRQSTAGKLLYLFFPCASFGVLGIALAMVVDFNFFGIWTLPFLGNFHFNVVLNRADLYGSHPFHWYFTAGLPAISGILLPFLLWDLGTKMSYGQRNLWLMVASYLLIMSFNSHKEFRYIHPVLPLVCLITGRHVRSLFVGRTRSKTRIVFFGVIFILLNLTAVGYLGLFHQSGPIKVNHHIVDVAKQQHENQQAAPVYSIHYLTGACHSTPLHSHLHAPPLVFETWALDCSPACRADPTVICEFESFDRNPARFVEEVYRPSGCAADQDEADDNYVSLTETCSSSSLSQRPSPDFAVTFSQYALQIQAQLESRGLREIARYPHHVNGIRIGEWVIGKDVGDKAYRKFFIFDWLDVSLEEMILYSRF